ncbi:MAG: T9SS type A sorting domain-containing protein [Bacteroidota bacterium]
MATDSIGAFLMGLDCEASTLPLPDGGTCDNYLHLLHQNGMGTNQLNEIEVLGDGAGLITSVPPDRAIRQPAGFQLSPNFPNPFNPSTRIIFFVPTAETVSVKVYSITGQEIETLVEGAVPAGKHDLNWDATGLASGVYLCRMQAGEFSETIRMVYQK